MTRTSRGYAGGTSVTIRRGIRWIQVHGTAIATHCLQFPQALLVVSDGGDNHSRFSKGEADVFATRDQITMYTVCLMDVSGLKRGRGNGPKDMNARALLQISRKTVEALPTYGVSLENAVTTVGRALRNQCLLSYRAAPGATQADKWRRMGVELVEPQHRTAFWLENRRGTIGAVSKRPRSSIALSCGSHAKRPAPQDCVLPPRTCWHR